MLNPFASALLTPDILALFATPPEDLWKGGRPFHGDYVTHAAAFPEVYAPAAPAPVYGPRRPAADPDAWVVEVEHKDRPTVVVEVEQIKGDPRARGRRAVPYVTPRKFTPNSEGQILTTDRSQASRDQWKLERAADALLRAADGPVRRIDVIDRDRKLPIVSPDSVAWRGKSRPVRFVSHLYVAPDVEVEEYRGDVEVQALRSAAAPFGPPTPIKVTRVMRLATIVTGRRVKFVGFRATAIGDHDTAAAKALARAEAAHARKVAGVTTKRGPARTAVDIAPRSLPRRWKAATPAQVEVAATVEAIVRTTTRGTVLALSGGGRIVVEQDVRLTLGDVERVCTPREAGRRVALAGAAVID